MSKRKNQKRKSSLENKTAVESLRFQTLFALKQMGQENDSFFQKLAETEISFISELGLTQDILDIKNLIDGTRTNLQAEPTTEKGDFCTSITAIALKIASIDNLDELQMPTSWQELIDKKILSIFFPEDKRNAVVAWAKANGYNTSTYLGCPIVKFGKLYIKIGRTRK